MPATTSLCSVRQLGLTDLSASDLAAWAALETRAVEPNAYLSPHFVLPAAQHLDPGVRLVVMVVERGPASAREIVALGVFTTALASRICPLPQLVGYQSRHSFLGGLLVDRDCVHEAVGALLSHARSGLPGWQLLVLPRMQSDGPVAQALEAHGLARGLPLRRAGVQERATLVPAEAGQDALRKALGKRYNEVERCKRRLADYGAVAWRCVRDGVDAESIEHFLRLEHQGWKADVGSSLRAVPADEAFFKAMTARFASEGRALFAELRVGERVIASTSNFVSGGVGFAFKVGWEADLRKYGPGLLNEAEFVRAAPTACADLAWFDSGAAPDSFINRLWTGRRELATLIVPLTRLGALGLRVSDGLRSVAIVFMHGYRFTQHKAAAAALARKIGFTQVSA